MKKPYTPPTVELFSYLAEKGFATTVALDNAMSTRDYIIVEGNERNSLRTAEEVTEYTDNSGEYETGEWL
jgi:hypothetical protein